MLIGGKCKFLFVFSRNIPMNVSPCVRFIVSRYLVVVSTFIKLAMNRQEKTHLSLFSRIYVCTAYFHTC